METKESPPKPIKNTDTLSEKEWKERLTPEQYRILRKAGTERPFGEIYETFKKQAEGSYYCAACGLELFSSAHKFESHCGWPSFYDPTKIDNVLLRKDHTGGRVRTEVVCANCEGHLGHLFEGEGFDTPTDKRFCINGSVLVFVPDENKSKPKEE